MINQNRLTLFLAVMFALAVIAIIVGGIMFRQLLRKHEEDNGSLRQAKKVEQRLRDSLKLADIRLANREKYWQEVLQNDRAALVRQMQRVTKKEIVYENTFTLPPPSWSQLELDNLRRAIIAGHAPD